MALTETSKQTAETVLELDLCLGHTCHCYCCRRLRLDCVKGFSLVWMKTPKENEEQDHDSRTGSCADDGMTRSWDAIMALDRFGTTRPHQPRSVSFCSHATTPRPSSSLSRCDRRTTNSSSPSFTPGCGLPLRIVSLLQRLTWSTSVSFRLSTNTHTHTHSLSLIDRDCCVCSCVFASCSLHDMYAYTSTVATTRSSGDVHQAWADHYGVRQVDCLC